MNTWQIAFIVYGNIHVSVQMLSYIMFIKESYQWWILTTRIVKLKEDWWNMEWWLHTFVKLHTSQYVVTCSKKIWVFGNQTHIDFVYFFVTLLFDRHSPHITLINSIEWPQTFPYKLQTSPNRRCSKKVLSPIVLRQLTNWRKVHFRSVAENVHWCLQGEYGSSGAGICSSFFKHFFPLG